MFTLKTVSVTEELGIALKNFRISHRITGKRIIEEFGKSTSYLTKLEKGSIKKIDGLFLVQLCNYIEGSDNGLKLFLEKLSQDYSSYSNETKFAIMNIDDLLLEHSVSIDFISNINNYASKKNIAVADLVKEINANNDIADWEDFNTMPENIWYNKNFDIDAAAIKLVIPADYIENLLNGNVKSIHRVIAEVILYSLYKLGEEEHPHDKAYDELKLYGLLPTRIIKQMAQDNMKDTFEGLEPDMIVALQNIIDGFKFVLLAAKPYGTRRLKQISYNMNGDLGFSLAYMSMPIIELEKRDRPQKEKFLKELSELIKEYSKEDTGINIYE